MNPKCFPAKGVEFYMFLGCTCALSSKTCFGPSSCIRQNTPRQFAHKCPTGFEIAKMDLTDEADKKEGKISRMACAKKCTYNKKCVGSFSVSHGASYDVWRNQNEWLCT